MKSEKFSEKLVFDFEKCLATHQLSEAERLLDANLEFFLRIGANASSLLTVASLYSMPSLITKLCELGCPVNWINENGETPLVNVIRGKAFGLAFDPLASIEILLKNGADPNIRAYDGCTSLHQAVIHKEKALIEILVRYGANYKVETDDHEPETALEIAKSLGFEIEFMELILKFGK